MTPEADEQRDLREALTDALTAVAAVLIDRLARRLWP